MRSQVRCARSFVRFGSFERLLHLDLTKQEQAEQVANLARYCISCCYPELLPTAAGGAEAGAAAYRALFKAVCNRTAAMCAGMMSEGFVHGVLNTDNLLLSGEVLDCKLTSNLPLCDRWAH